MSGDSLERAAREWLVQHRWLEPETEDEMVASVLMLLRARLDAQRKEIVAKIRKVAMKYEGTMNYAAVKALRELADAIEGRKD